MPKHQCFDDSRVGGESLHGHAHGHEVLRE